MSDDVITRAKASLGDYLSAPDTDRLIEDLIALAETQAQQLAELRELHQSPGGPFCNAGCDNPCPTLAILDGSKA